MDQRLGEDELEDKSFALVQAEDDRPKVSPGGVRPSLKDELDGALGIFDRRPYAHTRPCPMGVVGALPNRPVESDKVAYERVLLCLRRQALPQTRESDQILPRFGILT